MSKTKLGFLLIAALLFGLLSGAYLFSNTRPRQFLTVRNCEGSCLRPDELVGLISSVGIQRFSGLIPGVVKETDKTIVIEEPSTAPRVHYVIIPKKDIKDIGDLSGSDRDSLVDLFYVMSEIVREKKLSEYQIVSNGPEYQTVTYLHFHLTGR
ncbi:MAG: HIT domain-containing protein [bacterium]